MEREYKVSGMSCAGCAARVEKCVAALAGVHEVQVDLLGKAMRVRGEGFSEEELAAALRRMGFGVEAVEPEAEEPPAAAAEEPAGRRALVSLLLLVPLVAVHWALHGEAAGAWAQLALALPIMWLNRAFFVRGLGALLHGGPSMDTLVAMGAGVALGDGVVHLALGAPGAVYFESAGMILAFVSIGKWLEQRATQRTGRALESLAKLLPDTATLLRDGREEVVPAARLRAGDCVLVRPGARVPADGVVVQGASAVDEAVLTGESVPVDKAAGARVYAGTLNHHGALSIRVACAPSEYAMAGVIRLVRRAVAEKAPVARLADCLAAYFVPAVLVLACAVAAGWVAAGAGWDFALARGVAVLVISCPCALGLATPVAIMVGAGRGAEAGILFRTGAALESAGRVSCVVLDKTGTLTAGELSVVEALPRGITREELLQWAAALESGANHPLAKAIRRAGGEALPASGHVEEPGRGVRALVQGLPCLAGNAAFLRENGVLVQEDEALLDKGMTLVHVARAGEWLGTLALADSPRPTSAAAVQRLRALGLRVLMLTGDRARTAQAVAARVGGVDEVHAEALPADKEALVRRLQGAGERVAMVGDGVNDAPALARADVGVAIGAGVDVAIESAGVILMRSDPLDIARAVELSRAIMRKIRQNLFLALVYNLMAIPLAAGALYPLCGLLLPPAVAAAAMGLSSVSVVTNALRLRRIRLD